MTQPFLDEEEIKKMAQDGKEVIAENVRNLLRLRGWSQEELERRSSVAQKTVSNIVRSGSTMTNKLAAIAYAFGLEPWMMLLPKAWEIKQPKKLDALFHSYMECDREGQEHIERSADKEAAYQKAKK